MNARSALAYLHIAVLLFGVSGLIGKAVNTPALTVTCTRSLIGAAALVAAIALRRSATRTSWTGSLTTLFGGGILLALHWWTFFAAIQRSTVALGLLTFASYPLFVTALGWLILRERPSRIEGLACALVIAGLAVVVPNWNFGSNIGLAAALGFVSGFTFAALTLINRRVSGVIPPLQLVAVQTGTAGLILLPFSLAQFSSVSSRDWVWLILLGVVFTGLAHALFTASLKHLRVALVGVIAGLEPVHGIAAAWLLLGEEPSLLMLCGAALIVGANFLGVLGNRSNAHSR